MGGSRAWGSFTSEGRSINVKKAIARGNAIEIDEGKLTVDLFKPQSKNLSHGNALNKYPRDQASVVFRLSKLNPPALAADGFGY